MSVGKEQIEAMFKVSQMQLETVQAAVSMNAEAHADTQKLVHDLWECETVFLKQLDKMIRERVIPVPTGQKKKGGSVRSGEKEMLAEAQMAKEKATITEEGATEEPEKSDKAE